MHCHVLVQILLRTQNLSFRQLHTSRFPRCRMTYDTIPYGVTEAAELIHARTRGGACARSLLRHKDSCSYSSSENNSIRDSLLR